MIWEIVEAILLIAFLIYGFVSFQIYRKAIRTERFSTGGLVDQSDPFFSKSWEWFQNIPKETVTIRAYDHSILSAVYLPSFDKNSTNTAILCHGYHGANTDMVIIAKMYSELGFRVLMPDARGHGMSKGKFTSFGHYESYDLRRWIQYLLRTYGAQDSLLLHGVSMGAATILLAAGSGLSENVKALVADSPFSSSFSVLARGIKPRILSVFLPGVSLICGYFHRFFLSQSNVKRAVRKSHLPLFLFHGEEDELCPFAQAKRLLSASTSTDKRLYGIPKAKHAEGYIRDREGLDSAILAFLQPYFTLPKSVLPKKK
ncbi:MAG TPA: alpha/beta fold hydrolase [Bacillota bacterium]|nr:alpha/beta fold hydrolase [Bacillota bacterium]